MPSCQGWADGGQPTASQVRGLGEEGHGGKMSILGAWAGSGSVLSGEVTPQNGEQGGHWAGTQQSGLLQVRGLQVLPRSSEVAERPYGCVCGGGGGVVEF